MSERSGWVPAEDTLDFSMPTADAKPTPEQPSRQIEAPGEPELLGRLLTNPQFRRFSGGFEVYQATLKSAGNEDERAAIKERMQTLQALRAGELQLTKKGRLMNLLRGTAKVDRVIKQALQWAEAGAYTPEQLADAFVAAGLTKALLEVWSPKAGFDQDSQHYFVNELVSYEPLPDGRLLLHIEPTGVPAEELRRKILEGFRIIAEKIRAGQLDATEIVMKSWLLNKTFEPIFRRFFRGSSAPVIFEDVDVSDETSAAIQSLALMFNNRLLRGYLETGTAPEVRQVRLPPAAFASILGAPPAAAPSSATAPAAWA